jgi:hypothetical protein
LAGSLQVRQESGRDGAANALPMEGEMDWAVPQPRPGHTAHVSPNLAETTKSIQFMNRAGRIFHTRFEVSQNIQKTEIRFILYPFLR